MAFFITFYTNEAKPTKAFDEIQYTAKLFSRLIFKLLFMVHSYWRLNNVHVCICD